MAALLARLGRASARHRMIVIPLWLIALLFAGVVAMTGMKFTDASFDVPGTNSSKAMTTLTEKFGETPPSASLQLVVSARDGAVIDHADAVRTAILRLEAVPYVKTVSNPFDPATPYVSSDQTTAVVGITTQELSATQKEAVTADITRIAAELKGSAAVRVEVGGTLDGGVPDILGPSEIVGAGIAFLVLFVTFGSLVAAGANMLSALIGVGVGVLGILAFSAFSPIGSVTPILAVMLGLAVGIDYGLFIIARFRSELQDGRNVEDAIAKATGTSGSAVVFAGATVVIALVGLTVVGIPFLGEMGLAAAFAVIVAVAMSLTLVPALMGMMGRRALPKRLRRTSGVTSTPPRSWVTRWISIVLARPFLTITAAAAILIALAAPVLSLQTSLSIPGGEDPESSQRAAYDLIADKFGDGSQDPLVVLVSSGHDAAKVSTHVVEKIEKLPNVAAAFPSGISDDGSTALITVLADSGPLDQRTRDLIHDIRAVDVADSSIAVTGATALGLDSDEQLRSALLTYVILIVGLALILLTLLFRSLLVPLIATVGFLLSLGAGLGATVAVFQWGWFGSLIEAPQGNALLSLLPIIVTGILFGLAMDYQVFLVSRIHEAYREGKDPVHAIRRGFGQSAPVVVAAALIMTAVFGGFALSHSSLVGSIALALAVGVVADALVVRMILIPALLRVLGRAAWWLPAWLDRILPTIDVEGHILEVRESQEHELTRFASTR